MRVLQALVGGLLLGTALTLVFVSRRVTDPSSAPSSSRREAELLAQLEAARKEADDSRAMIEGARASGGAATGAGGEAHPGGAARRADTGEEAALSLQEREAFAERTLQFLRDPLLEELRFRHSREESGFPIWTASQFMYDTTVNPEGIALSVDRKRQFEALYTRAYQIIRAIDLKRQTAIAEAIAKKMEECLSGTEPPLPDPQTLERELVVSLSDGMMVALTREEFPEIALLQKEKEAAVVVWLLQAQEFFRK